MDKEFIAHLLSKIKDTPENRKMLTQFASGLGVAQHNAPTQKTFRKEAELEAVESQKTLHTDLEVYEQHTDVISLKTVHTTGSSTKAKKESTSIFDLDRYEDICLLGKGGMGEVRKVRDLDPLSGWCINDLGG